ncbi:hypothetical protein BGZ76_010354 [Entomortierella beljakovae]|nr:hypothetical protein BGZ76_010354 [Entomortierella beljakovae]
MVSVEEILSIVTAILFCAMIVVFGTRYLRSHWGIYRYIIIFLIIRVAAYSIRAYLNSGAILPSDPNYVNIYIAELILVSIGVVFIMKLIVQLYQSLLPKLRSQASHSPDLFERCLIERTRFFLMPLIALIITGAVLSTPDHSASDQETGLALRKVGVILLLALGLWYLFATYTYRNRYPSNSRAFSIAFLAIAFFVVSLIYKVIYTFYAAAQTNTGVFFIFSPLMELIALCILSVDLEAYFKGNTYVDEIEIQPAIQPDVDHGYRPTGYYPPQY